METDELQAARIIEANHRVHAREASIYDRVHPEIFGAFEQKCIRSDLEIVYSLFEHQPLRVMDLGCGTGNLALKFLEAGHFVRAVDLSGEMLSVLETKIQDTWKGRIELVQGDALQELESGEIEPEWDVISFSSVLHHLPDYYSVLRCAFDLIGPGGALYVCHEPLAAPDEVQSRLSHAIAGLMRLVDNFYIRAVKVHVYAWERITAGRKFRRMDYSLADYHLPAGISMTEILHLLEAKGARKVAARTYHAYFLDTLRALDDHLGITAPTGFTCIVQKPVN